jgi:Domain of Unknown Function with PDB structure (DUF3857)/Transglutaminase-like superfamily
VKKIICGTSVVVFGLEIALTALACLAPIAARGASPDKNNKWLPVAAEDLALKDNPASPGDHAMILYRELFRDDSKSYETEYIRIKIFDQQGVEYGNRRIVYEKGAEEIRDFQGRTIHPDGKVIDSNGLIIDSTILKAGGIRLDAKTVALPDVEPGSIVEYRFERHWFKRRLEASSLILQQDLFTRDARFSMIAIGALYGIKSNFTWVGVRLPRDHSMHPIRGGFELDAKNIAALPQEEFAPPEEQASSRVDYFYSLDFGKGHEDFWLEAGKLWNSDLEKFAARSGEAKRVAAETVADSDTPEEKLRKIYARVQKIRNLSGEDAKTEKEIKAEKLAANQSADDVIEHGYASWFDIDRLFAVMARAAGLQADPAYVAQRDGAAFDQQEHNVNRLNGTVVVAMAGPRSFYLDPGCALCPFGLLPWRKTAAGGVRFDKQGGRVIQTAEPRAGDATVERRAVLQIGVDGIIEGTLTVKYSGWEAIDWRERFRKEDETGRKKLLTDEVKGWLPEGAEVEIVSIGSAEVVEEPLTVAAKISRVRLGIPAGRRILLPVGVFGSRQTSLFPYSQRSNGVYFRFPHQEADSITIRPGAGWEFSGVPEVRHLMSHDFDFDLTAEVKDGNLQIDRRVGVNGFLFPVEEYASVKTFFDLVQAGDSGQAVMEMHAAGNSDLKADAAGGRADVLRFWR